MDNKMQLFLNFGAVLKIKRFYRDDLYKFCKLMEVLGFLKKEIEYFENIMKIIEENSCLEESYSDDYFWHIIDLNEGKQTEICIEYNKEGGFTFGKEKDYLDYDNTIEIIGVDDLIKACNKESEFQLDYKETSFCEVIGKQHLELATELDCFCEFYEWELVKFPNGTFNLFDIQLEEIKDEENMNLEQVIQRVYGRMTDYFLTEDDIIYSKDEEDINYCIKNIEMFIRLGRSHNLASEDEIKYFKTFLERLEKVKNSIDI